MQHMGGKEGKGWWWRLSSRIRESALRASFLRNRGGLHSVQPCVNRRLFLLILNFLRSGSFGRLLVKRFLLSGSLWPMGKRPTQATLVAKARGSRSSGRRFGAQEPDYTPGPMLLQRLEPLYSDPVTRLQCYSALICLLSRMHDSSNCGRS